MRISKEDYYFKVVQAVSLRGTCDRGRSGAILVKEGRIIATGYVGSPAGMPDCEEVGHEIQSRREGGRESTHCIRSVHAELNAVIQSARFGPSCDGAILFSSMFPCYDCAKALINAGVKRVFADYDYQRSEKSKALFKKAGVHWEIRNEGNFLY